MNKQMEKYRKVVSVNLSKVNVYNTAGIEPIGFKDQRIIPSCNWPYFMQVTYVFVDYFVVG